ncbi:amino acid adenylation domain-containing protein [Paenibacillus sp. KN14-4R]|uniref:amino acid adenylation domain-containing protein n=1 Tax=Paenibacillus sp. KN14-4R TaxID=3445773 RepID=UPI003F9EE925
MKKFFSDSITLESYMESPTQIDFSPGSVNFTIDPSLTNRMRSIAEKDKISVNTLLFTAFTTLLFKYTREEEHKIGNIVATENSSNPFKYAFINNVINENETFRSASMNADVKFSEFSIASNESDNYHDVIFDTVTMLKEISLLKELKFGIWIRFGEISQGINGRIEFNTSLFEKNEIKQKCEHFINILKKITENPEIKLCEIDMLSDVEKKRILVDFNETKAEFPKDKTISALFEEQVEKTPDNLAAVYEDKKLTYRELNEKANRLARVLRYKGVVPDSIVGVMAEPSIEMLIGIMATLKAGGGYLPIDTNYPKERIQYMLEDSGTSILLTQKDLPEIDFTGEIIDLNNEEGYSTEGGNLESINSPNALAYVIYTSGSTGTPKGVMVEHTSLVNLCVWHNDYYEVDESDRAAKYAGVGFDASVWEIFPYLISGASIHILSDELKLDVNKLNQYFEENEISIGFMPTQIFEQFIRLENHSLRKLLTGADTLRYTENKNYEIYNNYGPTEYTVVSTSFKIDQEYENIPIGKPINNTKIYIVDKNNNLQPIGVPGEICLSGSGISRGYLNNEDLTKEKFIENPFESGTYIYKTGDLGRWLSDGNIEFLGRIDSQVKIRGYRIELGEIESQLLKYEGIKQAVVLDKQDGQGNNYLCAYMVSEEEITVRELRENLSQSLPNYMIPTYFMQIEKVPVTPNGKINRRALPTPDKEIDTGVEYVAPTNEVEEKLAKIWSEVLEVDRIGINDDFFTLGGHSLKAIKIALMIQRELNADLSVGKIFSHPTVRVLGEYIGKTEEAVYSPIEVVEEKELYEVSSAQKRMFALHQFSKQEIHYNLPFILLLEGELDRNKVEETLSKLVQRHEAFRTSFELEAGEIMQRIHQTVECKVEYEEINTDSEEMMKGEVEKFVKPFDLSKAPLLRVKLIRLAAEKHLFMFDMHHIISDGTSMSIFMEEFTKLYRGESLKELSVQYKDYSAWEHNLLKSEAMKKQEIYWTELFRDGVPVLDLPMDEPRPALQSFEGESIGFQLNKRLTEKLKKVGKDSGATLYMTLLSAYNILLAKYSGQEDIVVGSATAGRSHDDLQGVMGMFVNTLALRNYPEGKKSFAAFLDEVKQNALGAYENQDYPFDRLVEALNLRKDVSRNPLFDTMLVLQNTDTKEMELENISIREYAYRGKVSKFDMTLEAEEVGDEIRFHLEYCTKLFKRETIERVVQHFINIVKVVTENPEIKLCDIDMLAEEERHQLLHKFNDTYAEYPSGKSVHELFEEQVERTPDHIAIVFEDKELTYRELNSKANQVARTLRNEGIDENKIVGILISRSAELLIGILGVLKAGGTYLPIDTQYPSDRIEYMLKDSGAGILLTQESCRTQTEGLGIQVVGIEKIVEASEQSVENLNLKYRPDRQMYLIYTSGSTGNPKGATVRADSFTNLMNWFTRDFEINESDSILLIAPVGFDLAQKNLYASLIKGGRLIVLPEKIYSYKNVLSLMDEQKVTIVNCTPSAFQILVDTTSDYRELRHLKRVFLGGEPINIPKLLSWINTPYYQAEIVNTYGPTECTDIAAYYRIPNEQIKHIEVVPIGKPIDNVKLYIVNKDDQLLTIGQPGELCIAGDSLGTGYLNRPELTAEKFVSNPFVPGTKMYRTGDLARWLPDGNVEYLGRIDHQVKIRGFRIELGEIESQLLCYPNVMEAVVVARGEGGSKYLCAYIVGNKELTVGELRVYLSKVLPDYMIPSYFVQLDKFPLTPNGKVDRKALPEPDGSMETGTEYEAPRNETEEKLVEIWQEVLHVDVVGINDNFFILGGHSLKAIKMAAIVQRDLLAEISVDEIFKNPTVRQLAEYVGNTKQAEYSSIEAVEERERYEVSSAQKRLFALNQFAKEEISYNIPYVFVFEGKLDREKLSESFSRLVQRHEVFRTCFELEDGEIKQKIYGTIAFSMEYEERNTDSEEMIISEAGKFVKPFDLEKSPLLRVKLIRLAAEKHVVMMDMHHIISDGTSMGIILEELAKLYKGEALEELKIQYKDYSAWEHKMIESEAMKKQEAYWTNLFSDEIPVLNLPNDYPRPSFQSFEGESIGFHLDKHVTEKLKHICKTKEVTLYMTLLSAYNVLLSKYSGQEDIVVGSPISGRPHADLQHMVGMFVNTLAMRNYPGRTKTFAGFLQEVKRNALCAYEHQNVQFDRLVENLNLRKDLSRNPLFDTMFVLQNTDTKEMELDGVTIKQLPFERGVSKFDLTLGAEEKGEEICFELEYCTKLFKRETIERMIAHFQNIVKAVVENPEIQLCKIEMLSAEEKKEVVVDFNNTKAPYPQDKTICEAFEEQVKKTPDQIAVVYENRKLTYRELNEKANQLAGVLRGKGVKPDTIVGIMVDRSVEMMVGIMGIIKAGGAYLPISPDYPSDRITYMLEDSKTTLLLTQKHLMHTIQFEGMVLDLEDEQWYQGDKTNVEIVNHPNDLVYVIYTSGSTGRPKGVMIQHGNVINLVTGLGKIIYDQYTGPLQVALVAQYVFDASVKQIFASLLRGDCLHLIPEDYRTIGEKLVEYYIDHAIDVSDGTPSHLKLILSDNREIIKEMTVKHFIFGGEELTVSAVKDFFTLCGERKPEITNIYGPTECCVDSTAFLIDRTRLDQLNTIPIGRPLVNYCVYVLDKDNHPQPVGVPGELCIAGDGLARGYLNNPELTEEKFVANPFAPGERMYKTGDLVKWLPDGNVQFLGRIDHQVKIRGYRIEIGEIEATIKSYPSVQDAVVLVREDNAGENRIFAYIVPKTNSEEKYSEAGIKEYVKKQLPQYMIPAKFVQLELIPLNTNGKVDRFALPEPDLLSRDSDEGFVAPRNKEEMDMAEIWAGVLGIEKIGIDEDFFDLGGDSFKAIKLVRSISNNLGVMELFKNSTIRELVAYLSQSKGAGNDGNRTMLHELTKPIDEKHKVVSLICFPYGGGSAISYQPLANSLPKNYSLYAVELPGHDYSCPDEELASIEESAARCLEEIKQKVKGPVVLYGHCLGATMSVLLAPKLEEAGIQVNGVVVGAMFPTPRITNKFFDIWEKIFPTQLTDKGNRDMLKMIGGLNSEFSSDETEFVLRNLKHDAKECVKWYTQHYSNKNNTKFHAPITCIIGEGDRATEFYQERYKEWEYFSDDVDLRTIDHAGHFFFKNQVAELVDIIEEKVDVWKDRSSKVSESKKMNESKENRVRLNASAKNKVVPSMKLFLMVAFVQIISEIGTILSTFGTGIWIFNQTNALSEFAMMFLMGMIPTILVLPFAGAIVDRFDRRVILIISDLLSTVCSLGLLILLGFNELQLWHVYVFTIVLSVANSFRQPAYMAAVTQITPKMYLPQANSVSQFSVAIGGVLAAIFGGVFMDSIGFKGLVIIDLITFGLSVIVLLFLRFPDTMFTRSEEPIRKELMGGWNFIMRRKSLIAMVVFFVVVNFLLSIFTVTMTPLILSFTNSSTLGILNAFAGIGVLCGAIAMLITGGMSKRAKGMVGFVLPLAISIMIAGIQPLPIFAAIALFVSSLSITITNIHWQSLIQVKVGLELQGRVFAVNRMLVALLAPVSYIVAGVLADNVFTTVLTSSVFDSPIVNLILGPGAGREMRLSLLLAGAVLFVWSIIGIKYKPLSDMDDILEDATPGEVIIKDKDKLQRIADEKVQGFTF